MRGHDEIESGKNGGESGDKNGEPGRNHVGIQEFRTQRSVERPAGIDAAVEDGVEHQRAADDVEIPAQQVDARESQVLGPDHDRQQEIPEHRWHRGNQKEKDHHLAVHGEELVIGIGLHQVAGGRKQFQADQQRE